MRRFSLRRFSLRRFSLRSLHCGAFTAEPSLRNLHCELSLRISSAEIVLLGFHRVLTAHAWWLCQCETGACQYHWCSIYRGLERVGSWVPGGSVGRDQLAMAAKVRRHWFNPCRLGSRGHLGADFSLLLYTDLIKKRKPSRHITDDGELIRDCSLCSRCRNSF